ncbi:MAG: aldo/keto reductase [Clostridia bacterium]|nr:aldo/keto reductase [Clostridia bacterium]
MEYVKLNNGIQIPMEGFGVFQVRDKEECRRSVLDAIRAGYRLIDTAASYTNEDAVGEAVREAVAEGICTREELFITSKMWVQDMENYDMASSAVDASLKALGLEYLDMYLLHQAMKDYFSAWRAMEDAYRAGKIRAIGVSNFYPNILTNFCETVRVIPAVNQVELHPYFTQEDALKTMREYGVVPEAWAPLGGGRYNPFDNEMLKGIADAHGKSVGQIILRWNVQRGVVIIPRSTRRERIEENMDIWDFVLTPEEMTQIGSLDMGYGDTRTKHFDPDFVRMCVHRKIHD